MSEEELKAYYEQIKAQEAAKEPRFWWHWQNLKKDEPRRVGIHGRAWLHQRPQGEFGIEWHLPTTSFHIRLTVGGNHQLDASVGCGLFALYVHFDGWSRLRKFEALSDWRGKETSLDIYSWAIHWKIWTPEHEWSTRTPKWRDGYFNIPDFLLGRAKYTKVDQAPIPVIIPMLEGTYAATVTFFSQEWKRPRWPIALRRDGANIDIDSGIPIPGKSCGDDAYFSIGTSATTVKGAIQHAIDTVMERRKRYGGENWMPERTSV